VKGTRITDHHRRMTGTIMGTRITDHHRCMTGTRITDGPSQVHDSSVCAQDCEYVGNVTHVAVRPRGLW
jgi:hypothetical protein